MATDAPTSVPLPPGDRLRAVAVTVAVAATFLVILGPLLFAPTDPMGCVSLTTVPLGWGLIPVCILAAFLAGAAVTLISAARVQELGVFTVALGLALAAMPHDNAGYLWASFGKGQDTLRRSVAWWMMLESAGWIAVAAAAHLGSRWCITRFDLKPGAAFDAGDEVRNGGLTVLFMILVAALMIQLVSSGTELAPIETGQVYFTCAVSFYLASLVAYQLTGAHSPLWSYLAVGMVAIGGYAWSMISPTPQYPGRDIAHLIHLAPTAFGRALPIQMVMAGVCGAVLGNWHQRQLTHYALEEGMA